MLKKELWQVNFSDLIKSDLYGIDGYYQEKASQLGMETSYILSHMPEHLGRSIETDPLYSAYKVIYTFELTRDDYTTWRRKKTLSRKERLALFVSIIRRPRFYRFKISYS